jgi:hypothetical protein
MLHAASANAREVKVAVPYCPAPVHFLPFAAATYAHVMAVFAAQVLAALQSLKFPVPPFCEIP